MLTLIKGSAFTLFVCSVLTVAVLLFVIPAASSPLIRALFNSGHIALFAVFSVVCYPKFVFLKQRFLPNLNSQAVCVLLFTVLTFCFGVAIEFIQAKVGRDSSWADVALNMLGVTAGLCVLGALKYGKTARGFLCVAVVLTACLIAFYEPYKWAKALHYRNSSFPTLVDFSNAEVNKFAQGNYGTSVRMIEMPTEESFAGGKVLQVYFSNKGVWPGWKLVYPYPDWSDYSRLSFRIFSPGKEPVDIVFRVNDELHNNHYNDRFNKSLTVKPGLNQFSIALDDIKNAPEYRTMDMSKVGQLVWFAVRPDNDFTLYFDSVVLKR